MRILSRTLLVVPLLLALTPLTRAADSGPDFTREVRPILAAKCFQCHGPDDKTRKAGLRLDERSGAIKELKSGSRAIVPNKPEESALVERITSTRPSAVMPPAKAGKPLTPEEIATLRRWVEHGAPYPPHWAYVKPVRPPLPTARDAGWCANPIDYFVLARLEKEGLHPSAPADRYALVRRVTLDLTGLPPTLAEADRFVHDSSPDAYDRLVDRLLASPAYGERWAQVWLDLARYADSQGYANDPDRTIWRYRDWVIEALNHNLPYDQFTIQQLAGDLLPNPTPEQRIATGFHRNTLTNTEGGTNPEEFRSVAVVDRVNTTFQVWLGTTIACAQCHNHKYDPFTQKEYYQLYAIFNNSEDANTGDDAPTITTAVIGQEEAFSILGAQLAEARKRLDEETRKIDARQKEWEEEVAPTALPKDLAALVDQPREKRDKKLQEKLTAYHRGLFRKWVAYDAEVKALAARFQKVSTTTPVMREGKPRPTHVHHRGNFQDLGEAVNPGLPAVFPQPPMGEPMNRLTLARWLVSPDNPLTARVAVNRLWEEVFGVGIVLTSEDFGTQGELPSHPELLDWLATEYQRTGWDTKAMLRLLVTSAAYRQTSAVSEELRMRDPFNRLLARGPRVRLEAETVRDQALFVSGLLTPKQYGPPVQPPRPNFGLSAAFGSTTDWKTDTGEDRYRRGLYIRWRRNAPYPSLTTFDAPERTFCTVRRLRTNTPLQALVTLNDPVYVEAAQALASRIVREGGATTHDRVVHGFRLCLSRPPSEKETKRLEELFEQARAQFTADPAKATAMATKPLGAAPSDTNVMDLAAWTVVGNVLLNLDETLAKR